MDQNRGLMIENKINKKINKKKKKKKKIKEKINFFESKIKN